MPQPVPPPKVPAVEIRSISPSKWQGGARDCDSPRRSQLMGVRAQMEPRALGSSSPALLSTSPRSVSPLRAVSTAYPSPPSPAPPFSQDQAVDTESSKRTKVARELLSSERVYLTNLRLVVNTLLQPVKTRAAGAAPVDAKALDGIFLNLEGILAVNSELERSLAERMAAWNDETCCVGDIFLRLGPYLKMYTHYASRYDAAHEELLELQKENAAFNAWMAKWREEQASGHTLGDFLIQPVQRIPRYNLLLSDLIKRTEASHPDYVNLQQALAAMQGVAAYVNDSIRESENKARLLEIHKSFYKLGDHLSLIEPHRSFIREGTLTKVCRSSRKARRFFLFTDILVYASSAVGSKHLFHGAMELLSMRIEDVVDSEAKKLANAFLISAAKKSFVVYADSPAEKNEWMTTISQTTNAWREKRATLKMGSTETSEAAPVWTPDGEANICAVCSTGFTFVRRKHHCRACGKVVCGDCSQYKLVLPHLAKEAVRVCRTCYNAHLPQPESVSLSAALTSSTGASSNGLTGSSDGPVTPPMSLSDKRATKSLSMLGFGP